MNNTDITEDELVKGCVSGNKENWNIFIQRFNKLIYHSIYKTLRTNQKSGAPDDANDLFQEVFASLCADNFKKLKVFDPAKGCSLTSWLRMITVQKTIDFLRKSRQHVSLEDLPAEPSHYGNQEKMVNEEALNAVEELLEKLPANDRLLMELSYIRELPPKEAAQILNVSVEAFYTRKSRIIEKLKKRSSVQTFCKK